jgi:hypothetical protein
LNRLSAKHRLISRLRRRYAFTAMLRQRGGIQHGQGIQRVGIPTSMLRQFRQSAATIGTASRPNPAANHDIGTRRRVHRLHAIRRNSPSRRTAGHG